MANNIQYNQQLAVYVKNSYKSYGSKENSVRILNGLNMTVPKGTIYGLLGASGCGKTTLLSCIVGRKKFDSGELWVLGGKPGTKGSGVPGPQIGYMPQEIALTVEFTALESLRYFAWIAGIETEKIQSRIDFLIKLLMIPNPNQAINTLSGGQQRRVSLAAALVHEPDLLILDEPTVGLDPVLRQNIWDYLVRITKEYNATIIITTHYIDETRQANFIALMRGGYFLAEESPDTLLSYFGVETLENVFLKLSLMQEGNSNSTRTQLQDLRNSTNNFRKTTDYEDVDQHSREFNDRDNHDIYNQANAKHTSTTLNVGSSVRNQNAASNKGDYFLSLNKHHMKALFWKNFIRIFRNVPALLFVIALPIVQVSLFCITIGHNPRNIEVAVVNYETNNSKDCNRVLTCNSTQLSCSYMEYLEEKSLILKYFNTEEEARQSVLRGKTYASIVIKSNYSQAFRARVKNWRFAKPSDIEYSEIAIFRDLSSVTISTYLKVYLYETFLNYLQDFLESCKFNRRALTLPIKMEKPVYGLAQPNFTDFAAPGIILTIVFFLAVALTAAAMIIERNDGSLERILVAGITGTEMLVTYIVGQIMIIAIQTTIVMICTFVVFKMTMVGSLGLVVLLILVTGLCGMCFGFVISCVCETERTATYMAMGSFLPLMILSGIIWPIEAMHHGLQIISFTLPLTKATESVRSILQKGWKFSEPVVYKGFISVFCWIAIFLIISFLLLKYQKN